MSNSISSDSAEGRSSFWEFFRIIAFCLCLFLSFAWGGVAHPTISNLSVIQDDNGPRDWTIQGQVVEDVEPPVPMAGVTIIIKGTQLGTQTDNNGYFSIKARRGDVIVFMFIGFKNYEHVVTREINNLTIPMDSEISQLEEVVVTGISTERKMNSVSAVSTLDVAKNMATKPITSLSQALQGGVVGMSVTQSSGMPGADAATIKIRGISSLITNNDPLVLVDGIPMDMNYLDPNTIESVTILKDAAASAIYGARAANGVIVIKTKRGMPGRVKISYNGYFGIQKPTYLSDTVDGATYMELVNEAYTNIGGDARYTQEAIDATRNHTDPIRYPDTDWVDYIYHDGWVTNHSFGVSGGSNLARFAFTFDYQRQSGIIDKTKANRLNCRANTTVNLQDNLSIDMDFNAYRWNRFEPYFGYGAYASQFLANAYQIWPIIIPKYPAKEGSDLEYYGWFINGHNAAMRFDHGGNRQWLEDNISLNIAPRWEVIKNLILRGQASYRVGSGASIFKQDAWNMFDYWTDELAYTIESIRSSSESRSNYYYVGGTGEYTWEKDVHRIFGIAGANCEQTNSGEWNVWSMVSAFGKVNYSFDDRYLVEGTIRRDGSSRFGKNHKWGTFPSVGVGWNMHNENFVKDNLKFINNFKLRASWGKLGNENISQLYMYQTLISASNGVETQFGNPDLTWETVHMWNWGADMRFFNSLDVTLDFYDKTTHGMILQPDVSYVPGTSKILTNSGKMNNKGWEIDVRYGKQITEDFGINVHLGLSHNNSKIKKLVGGPYDYGTTIDKEGYPQNSWYVYHTEGLLQEDDFVKNADGDLVPAEGVVIFNGQEPGDIHYIDENGDGVLNIDDRVIRGDTQPDYNYLANVSFDWRHWSFECLLQGVTGVDGYYTNRFAYPIDFNGTGYVPMKRQTDVWRPDNTDAKYPKVKPDASYGNNNLMSDFWHFSADFCRVRYIQIGYTFDQMGLKKAGISSIRVYLNAQNPFTFSSTNDIDPESRGQIGAYPLLRTYSFGLNINL